MSTNYYTVKRCDHCEHEERLHIGLSAGGWCFALCIHPDEGIRSIDDWRKRLESLPEGTTIVDEYDNPVTLPELLTVITERKWPFPTGLRRAKIDGERCIGHGEGTWDIHVGDFS